jgi:SM-20-related protein
MPSDLSNLSPRVHGELAPAVVDHLVEYGWCHQDAYLPKHLMRALAKECAALKETGGLQPAAVGRGNLRRLRPDIRTDEIAWLTADQSAACGLYLNMMDNLRRSLNVTLYLGLEEYESHFAHFSRGAFYGRHLDRFADSDTRTVSVVLYLNTDWAENDGGALRLFPEGRQSHEIAPLGGRLVVFLSSSMQHEVLPAHRNRLSIAGWFRRRARGL